MKKIIFALLTAISITFAVGNYEVVDWYQSEYEEIVDTDYVRIATEIITDVNKKVTEELAGKISQYIYDASTEYNLDFEFVLGIMRVESRFNPKARSYCGAIGLMQLMPKTAKYIAKKYDIQYKDLYDIESNIKIGTAYIHYLKNKLDEYEYVAAGYNGGSGVGKRWRNGSANIPKETKKYVPLVMNYYNEHKVAMGY